MPAIMTFEEWKAANPDIEETLEDCVDCNGDGDDECPCCGRYDTCKTCNGTGKKRTLIQLYREQRNLDEAKLKAWNSLVPDNPRYQNRNA